ncbi:MAG TPA: 50S ribosomal protein L23 [Bacillota bacterium]|nr:50S ribosomal protein L23 [Bacillota bacterium]HOH11007.1 50S ribosomal protein L23 [Bacillota bacterium]HOS50429.1 50S ribosomal protein L23 [Bacillota bacterium]HOY89679.1 50S ribosomal protein L23 [Bacillota bacterium]HPM64175.1 50S ribosomal protein L23 [Bacillota bacterium]
MQPTAHDIIIRPIITEKSTLLSQNSKYVFEVAKSATKIDIAKAVAEAFKVTVVSVNTVSVPGKLKRMGKGQGYSQSWKKAIVTLKAGERIPIFEGA